MKKKIEILRILAALQRACGSGVGFRLGQVNEFSSFSRSTTYRHLRELVEFGAVNEITAHYRKEPAAHYSISEQGKSDWLGEELF